MAIACISLSHDRLTSCSSRRARAGGLPTCWTACPAILRPIRDRTSDVGCHWYGTSAQGVVKQEQAMASLSQGRVDHDIGVAQDLGA